VYLSCFHSEVSKIGSECLVVVSKQAARQPMHTGGRGVDSSRRVFTPVQSFVFGSVRAVNQQRQKIFGGLWGSFVHEAEIGGFH
jgi:hypothetical protein